ncbi:MAG: hypothetical protein GWN73_34105, partial [Actinobacteria bacterium]|nr:hypothetical protein [Actinomycetota bacterium]NIT98145.1 hypothetical protein [Actinomycetota bacterium]NIU70144.1 hypothetical protein [Actinomycetota bacterium]NIV58313.1 hypothetical protein [Actinomycetota bacterium]NIV89859.1 hypothetical protein [Actinomycetota bacterium]
GTFLGNDFVGTLSVPAGPSSVPDRYNVVENVYLDAPTPGTWTIRVAAYQVSQDQEPERAGVNQDFSLVFSQPPVTTACADGVDNDGDGLVDLDDPGCQDALDDSERSPELACDDGIDNDGDGLADYPADPGCGGPTWTEAPQCQ